MNAYSIFKATTIIGFSYVIYFDIIMYLKSIPHKYVFGLTYTAVLTVILCALTIHIEEPYKSLVAIVLGCLLMKAISKESLINIFIYITISFALSHILFLVSSFIALFIAALIHQNTSDITSFIGEMAMLAFTIETVMMITGIKRKINILDYKNRFTGDIGVCISTITLMLYSLSRGEIVTNKGWTLFMISILLCAVCLLLCLKKEQIIAYNDNVQFLVETKLKNELQEVRESQDTLERIVHKNAKLLPAYRKAVEQVINNSGDKELVSSAYAMLMEFRKKEVERAREAVSLLQKGQKLPLTGMIFLDSVLDYMLEKSVQSKIDFDLAINGKFRDIENIVSNTELETLVADLIQNAINAVKESSGDKKILVCLFESCDIYEIQVNDTGEPFKINTLIYLGKQRVTTNADAGGKGIGFVEIFRIVESYHASFIISERPSAENQFTKSISIRFDGNNKKIIHSHRMNEIKINNIDLEWVVQDLTKEGDVHERSKGEKSN